MLDINAFSKCIRDNLKDRRFGKERADEIVKQFEERAKVHIAAGKLESDAGLMAMRETFDRMSNDTAEKAKRTAKALAVQASAAARLQQALTVDASLFGKKDAKGVRGSRGEAIGHAVKAFLVPDKRFSGPNVFDLADTLRGQAWSMFGDYLDKITVGAFGHQKGKAHLPNIAREIFGTGTGDKAAKELADGWLRVSDFLVDSFNAAGGSMRKLERYLPQAHNAAKMLKQGEDKFIKDHLDFVDWNKTRWPDGSTIEPAERESMLRQVFDTQSSNGANKIDPTAFRGRGRALGNALERHRFMHYKDAEAWLQAHELYGDGNVFDVMSRHIADLTHRTAMVEVLGPNPDMALRNIQQQAIKLVYDSKAGAREKAKLEGVLKNRVQPIADVMMRTNPMDPESTLANVSGTVSNLITSAVLGGLSLTSIPGDIATTAAVRRINGMPMMGGMKFYLDSIVSDRALAVDIANSSGWINEASINHMYSVERFNNTLNTGASWSRRLADFTIRASGASATTNAARFRARAEMTAWWARTAKQAFDDRPDRVVMERYGITAAEWDAFRNIKPYSPKEGVNLLRPIDIFESNYKGDKTALFRKFQGLVLGESRGMVPDSTIEASVTLKGSTRPDTWFGAILQSFSMYKNFPLTFFQMYGQYAKTTETAGGRLSFMAGLAAATTIGGMVSVQLGELKNGRDPMPVDGKFLLKSFMKGGGAGIWGDFLYASQNDFGGGPAETIAGPLVGAVGDAAGPFFKEIGGVYEADDLDDYDSKLPSRLVDFAHRFTPGSNLWYTQALFNKMLWEKLEDAADPQMPQKRRRRMRQQEQRYGNKYYWEPGETEPDRAPDFGNMLGGQ